MFDQALEFVSRIESPLKTARLQDMWIASKTELELTGEMPGPWIAELMSSLCSANELTYHNLGSFFLLLLFPAFSLFLTVIGHFLNLVLDLLLSLSHLLLSLFKQLLSCTA